jgi:arylsulfatase
VPWVLSAHLPSFADDVWELYGPDDWTQSQNIAAENPDMLAHLQQLWLIEATKYHVLPLDDRRAERFNPDLAGRPTLIQGNSELLFGGMGRLSENTVLNIKNKSHAITAEVVVPETGAAGVIVAQGGAFGGWSLYARDGVLTYCYNFFGLEQTHIAGSAAIPAGTHQVRMEFAYDGDGVGKGGAVTLYVDGQQTGAGRVERTVPNSFSADETCDIGADVGSPVSSDYGPESNTFSGSVTWVQIDLGADDHDHLISPEERFQVAMARQ